MKLLSTDNYIKFKCIGGECPISCCGGDWGIPIDEASMEYYNSVEGEFGERLRNGIVRMNDTNMFRLDDKTRDCVFLNENKLCSIYRSLGPDALCETCRTYPRMMYDVGDMTFCYLTNSCPEVNRMIMLRREKMNTLFDDSGDEADGMVDYDRGRFNEAMRAFNAGMHLIQNRELSLGDRLYLMLFYVDRFQHLVRNNADTGNLIEAFSYPEIYSLFLEKRIVYDNNCTEMLQVFKLVYRLLMSGSYEHPMWDRCRKLADDIARIGISDIDLVKETFRHIRDEGFKDEFERLMEYRYFAVFMQGFDSADYLDKLAYEVVKYVALITYIALTEAIQGYLCTQEDRILFYSLCSRIDHTVKKKGKLINELKQEGYFTLDKLIRLI